MTSALIVGLIILGLAAGYFSGLVGIGGGVIIVPVLVFIYGLSQHKAQGTTLALLIPPIGFLAALKYYKEGLVDVKMAAFICLGFVIGSYLGSVTAINLSEDVLKKLFGFVLILLGIRMFLRF